MSALLVASPGAPRGPELCGRTDKEEKKEEERRREKKRSVFKGLLRNFVRCSKWHISLNFVSLTTIQGVFQCSFRWRKRWQHAFGTMWSYASAVSRDGMLCTVYVLTDSSA